MTLRDWLRDHPPPAEVFTQTAATVAGRVVAGEDFKHAIREFLDEFSLRPEGLRSQALLDRPALTGDTRYDAFLAALTEHLAIKSDLDPPAWTRDANLFLDRFWFVSETKGFRAISIAQAPAAFRRRGIFVPAASLERV